MRKRVLSLLLAICLVIGLLPPTALAADPADETLFKVHFTYDGNTAGKMWEVKANSVYYGYSTSSSFEDKGTTDPGDGNWNIKLDTTGSVPQLTLKNFNATETLRIGDSTTPVAGDFNIVVDGENSISITRNTLDLYVNGTTTISSETNGTLTLSQNSPSAYQCINSTGSVVIKDVNIIATSYANSTTYAYMQNIIGVTGSLTVDGGSLAVTANGIITPIIAGSITVKDFAQVTVNTNSTSASGSREVVYALKADTIDIQGATVKVTDSNTAVSSLQTGSFVSAFKVKPTTGNVEAKYSESIGGTLQDIDIATADETAWVEANEAPYVQIEAVCPGHVYDGPTDATCNICGDVREVSKPITVTVDGTTWNAAAGQTYYATAASGTVADLSTTAPADGNWNIMLDNSKPVAELTLKGVTLTKYMSITGDGALKIIVDSESSIDIGSSTAQHALTLGMGKGATITSLNNSKLSLINEHTSSYCALAITTGKLTLDHANLYLRSNQKTTTWVNAALRAFDSSGSPRFDVDVKGGTLTIDCNNTGVEGIRCKNLTISEYAVVTITNTAGTLTAADHDAAWDRADGSYLREAVDASENITINNATLVAINQAGCWQRALNKMPVGLENVIAQYSTTYDAAVLETLDTNATGEITYPYVAFTFDCDEHVYEGIYGYICKKCGYKDETKPRDITVHVVTDGGATQTTPLTGDYDRTVTVPAGEVYYGIANGDGLVTDFKKYDAEPADWSFMLDNRGPEALLVFNNTKLTKTGTYSDANGPINLLTVSGEGALKIVLRGTSTFTSGYGHLLSTAMARGTTYTSENGGKLNLVQTGTSVLGTLSETVGKLTFLNANVDANNTRYSTSKDFRWSIINAAKDMEVIGGKLKLTANDTASRVTSAVVGITVGGKLTLRDYAIVSVEQNSTKADEYGTNIAGTTPEEYKAAYPRHGVKATEIEINNANLYILDKTNKFDYAINMMPALTGNVKAYQGANVDGSDRLEFTSAEGTIEYAYVAFVYDCNGVHTYDPNNQDGDPDCDKCGEIREVPRDITATFAYQTDGSNNGTLYDFTQTVPAGKVYYAKTDANGVFTTIGVQDAADPVPAEWTIKLDNTQPTAVLTLHNAYLKKLGQIGATRNFNAIEITGEGALQIVVDGESTVESEFNNPFKTNMVGGTTYTSVNNSLLKVLQVGTSGAYGIYESVGTLNFENANIFVSHRRQGAAHDMVYAVGDLNIKGGNLSLNALNCSVRGIYAAGNLTISDLAQVTLLHSSSTHTTTNTNRYAIHADGAIAINGASVRIKDTTGLWDTAINKMPTLDKVNAEYSENADGTGAVALPQDATFPVDYPYVGFIFDCVGVIGNHTYDPNNPEGDPDCELCGFVRDVPRDVTVQVVTGAGEADKTTPTSLANAKRKVVIKAKEVYYAIANEAGFVTEFKQYETAPADWDFMVDNTGVVAKLVFADKAKLSKEGTYSEKDNAGNTIIYDLLTVSGEGALDIVINGNVTLSSGYGSVIATAMKGGTTYTSVNNGKLTLTQSGTSGLSALTETAGNLFFKDANIRATNNRNHPSSASSTIKGSRDVNISGGSLEIESVNCSTNGLEVGGKLKLTNWAKVSVIAKTSASNRYQVGATNPRYAVMVTGDITIDNANLRISDSIGSWDVAINKMPALVNAKAEYSANADGSNAEALTPADPSATVEHPYVAFVYDCKTLHGDHTYDNQGDPDCNKCGEVRIVPYPITVTITNLVNKVLPDGKQIVWNAAIGQIYYATTDASGVVTDLGTTNPGDGNWNIKLDNTKPVAELTFRNATIMMDGDRGLAQKNSAITVAGEGTLKIIIDGNSSVTSGYNNTIATAMKGGTTYTSVNNGKLTLNQSGTSGGSALTETAGVLNFKDANIRATNNRNHPTAPSATVSASYDVIVSGGSLEIEALNCSTQGLSAGGKLKLTDWAKVSLIAKTSASNRYQAGTGAVRHAVKANGEFVIDNASLRISDAIGSWDVAVNKSPTLIGGTAKYSENADGTNLQTLNPADPAAAVEYPYVAYVINCAEHIWDNEADPDCNRCGEIRAVPYDIQVVFQYGTAELLSVAWDAKVGEVYYATTTASGQITDLGKMDSEPANWNIKLDNTGPEAVLTLRSATIIRKVRPMETFEPFNIGVGALGTITVQGKGALRIVCEEASTITTDEAYGSIETSMSGGTTYESKNNAKLTLTGTSSATTAGIHEAIGNLTFENANLSVKIQKTHPNFTCTTVSCPQNMTVIGGRVEIIAAGYANNSLNVKGDLLVKENGILIVTTGSSPAGGDCKVKPYGMTVDGDITVENATLMVKKYGGSWSYLINKMPIMVGVEAYMSENSTKESKLTAFSKDAGADMTELEAKFFYFSNAKPGTLDDSAMEDEEEEEDEDFIFDDFDNPFTGDTVNLTLLFVLVMTSAAALVVLFSKKKIFRE